MVQTVYLWAFCVKWSVTERGKKGFLWLHQAMNERSSECHSVHPPRPGSTSIPVPIFYYNSSHLSPDHILNHILSVRSITSTSSGSFPPFDPFSVGWWFWHGRATVSAMSAGLWKKLIWFPRRQKPDMPKSPEECHLVFPTKSQGPIFAHWVEAVVCSKSPNQWYKYTEVKRSP